MNALWKKEIRLLLPVWLGALGFVLAGYATHWILPKKTAQFVFTLAVLASGLMLGLTPFGQELKTGTLVGLLMQPVSRGRLLTLKLGLVLAAVVSVWAVAASLNPGKTAADLGGGSSIQVAVPSAQLLFGLIVLATGGLWTTLLCRQTSPAFWLTLLAPLGLVLMADWFAFDLWWMAGIYSAAGLVLAIVLFLRWQEVPQTAARFFAQANTEVPVSGFGLFTRRRGTWSALWAKELLLHREGLLVALTLLALHLAAMMGDRFRLFADISSAGGTSIRELSRHCFVLWLIVPIFIGCRAVAEERRMNTLAGLWCLPVSRTRQTALKLVCALLLGCLFGGVAPWLLEQVRALFGLESPLLGRNSGWDVLGQLAGISALLVVVSFYASTLSRQMLQAFGLTLVAGGFMALSFVVFFPIALEVVPWSGKLGLALGWPLLCAAVLILIFRNARRVDVGSSDLLRNFGSLGGTLVFASALSTAIHHRVWDAVLNPEPRHGTPRLQGTAQIVEGPADSIFVLLEDGRLWVNGVRPLTTDDREDEGPRLSQYAPEGGQFVAGGPWRSVASGFYLAIGLKPDGTLWNLFPGNQTNELGQPLPSKIGTDADWSQIAAARCNFLALKTNGTVWAWNVPYPKPSDNRMSIPSFSPQRLGRGTTWTNVLFWYWRPYSMSARGELFRWPPEDERSDDRGPIISADAEPIPTPQVQDHAFTEELGRRTEQAGPVRLMPDGTLKWEGQVRSRAGDSQNVVFTLSQEPAWTEVVSPSNAGDLGVTALKNDGTLWHWTDLDLQRESEAPGSVQPRRVSRNNDWIALDLLHLRNLVVGLAADGSLWLLPHVSDRDRANSLFAPRSAPMKLGNLFDSPAP